MIKVERILPYRPCDWNHGSKANFEITAQNQNGEEQRLYACSPHLTVAVIRAISFEESGTKMYPSGVR